MKLFIRKNENEKERLSKQEKGITFLLSCRVELNPEETKVVDEYKQWNLPVYSYTSEKGSKITWTLRDLSNGQTLAYNSLEALLEGERSIREACGELMIFLDMMLMGKRV